MQGRVSRRELLRGTSTAVAAGWVAGASLPVAADQPESEACEPFRYCLNTGTIMGQNLTAEQEVRVAAEAGYGGIEPWVRKLREHTESGGSLADLASQIRDAGLTVEGAIGFPAWAVDDEQRRAKALDEFQRDMELVAQLGGQRIAAPPAGINRTPGMDLRRIAERYRAVLELGRRTGVLPQLEIWGSALTLGRVAEAAYVAIEADDPDVELLLDVYHIYRGGSGFHSLRQLNGAAMRVFHMNDYPADPPREQLNDGHRVFPGDGVAPMDQILRGLYETGFRGALSLELFHREYWQQDALQVARAGREKMESAVRRALQADEAGG